MNTADEKTQKPKRVRTHLKVNRVLRALQVYLDNPQGLSDAELAAQLDVSIATARRYRREDLPTEHAVVASKYRLKIEDWLIELAESIMANRSKR